MSKMCTSQIFRCFRWKSTCSSTRRPEPHTLWLCTKITFSTKKMSKRVKDESSTGADMLPIYQTFYLLVENTFPRTTISCLTLKQQDGHRTKIRAPDTTLCPCVICGIFVLFSSKRDTMKHHSCVWLVTICHFEHWKNCSAFVSCIICSCTGDEIVACHLLQMAGPSAQGRIGLTT